MTAVHLVKAGALLFLAAILQVSVFSGITLLGGTPDLLLVTLVAVSLLRGSIAGALTGFLAGLVVDTASLEALGVTSLLLTVVGYWIGRYGETTGRDRAHAPFVSVAVVTVLYAFGSLFLRFLLGEPAPARAVLVDGLAPGILFNLVLALPVYAVCRALLPPIERSERVREVQLLG